MRILDRSLLPQEAEEIAAWEYPPPYDLYNSGSAETLMGPDYRPLYDGEELVGFVCFGAEARVPGQHEVPGTLDIGAGVRPDRVGQRVGTALMPLVSEYARTHSDPAALRVAVAAFNKRSQALCRAAGFAPVRRFTGPQGREFVELELRMTG